MCSLSRYVVIGGFTAMAVATATGSDLVGGLAAVLAIALTVLAGRRWPQRLGGTSCALPAPPAAHDEAAAPATGDARATITR